MDVVMPGQSGFQATRALSKDEATKAIPVIICTSKSQETDKQWGMKQGARDYVVKPVKGPELLAKIAALGQHTMENGPDRTSTPLRLSLRDYQRELAERLRQADSTRSASKLGVQVGRETWLVDLVEAGEVIPVPPITAVPLTRPWFRGVANVRGNLYSVVDFAAFVGVGSETTERARLVLFGERLHALRRCWSIVRSACAIRRNCARGPRRRQPGWVRAEYEDEAGGHWRELDVRQLVQHEQFLNPGQ